jgi:hypothetical protein
MNDIFQQQLIAGLITDFHYINNMKQVINHVGLFVIFPLLLTASVLLFIGEAEAVQYDEDPILKQGGERKQMISEEEPAISPIIKIIKPET